MLNSIISHSSVTDDSNCRLTEIWYVPLYSKIYKNSLYDTQTSKKGSASKLVTSKPIKTINHITKTKKDEFVLNLIEIIQLSANFLKNRFDVSPTGYPRSSDEVRKTTTMKILDAALIMSFFSFKSFLMENQRQSSFSDSKRTYLKHRLLGLWPQTSFFRSGT